MSSIPKPAKPYPSFPLFPHDRGYWAKKIDGKLCYFGRWDGPDGPKPEVALAKYCEQTQPTDVPRSVTHRWTLAEALNQFLKSRKARVEAGELAQATWREYKSTADFLVRKFGRDAFLDSLGPAEFEAYRQFRSKTRDATSLGNEIQRVKTMLTWAGKHTAAPLVDFGPDFRKPGKRAVKAAQRRRQEAEGIDRPIFTAHQIRMTLDECPVQLRAMVMLGINCAYYPSDCAALTDRYIKRKKGQTWLLMPRVKTEEQRSAVLWPETIAALDAWRASYQFSQLPVGSLFRRPGGLDWADDSNMVSKRFGKALRAAGFRTGSFRWLRNTFETIAGDCRDQIAVNLVMGHTDDSMAAIYRHGIEDDRVIHACEHVRKWLYGNQS